METFYTIFSVGNKQSKIQTTYQDQTLISNWSFKDEIFIGIERTENIIQEIFSFFLKNNIAYVCENIS